MLVTLYMRLVSTVFGSICVFVTYFSVSVSGSVTVQALLGPLNIFMACLEKAQPCTDEDIESSAQYVIPASMGNSAVWKPPCPTLRKGSLVPLTKSLLNSSAYPNHLLVNPSIGAAFVENVLRIVLNRSTGLLVDAPEDLAPQSVPVIDVAFVSISSAIDSFSFLRPSYCFLFALNVSMIFFFHF